MSPAARGLALTVAGVVALVSGVVWLTRAPDDTAWSGRPRADGVREITVEAHAWGFSPSEIHVGPGEIVRFVVTTDDIRHGFAIPDLGISLPLVPGREARSPALTVELPDGTYAIACTVFCGLGHGAMKGRLVVGTPPRNIDAALPPLAGVGALALVAAALVLARRRP